MWWIYTTIPLRCEFKDSDQVEYQKVCDTKVVFLINWRGWNIKCILAESSIFVLCTLTFDLDVFHLHFVFEGSWNNTRGLGKQHRDVAASAGYNKMNTGSERMEDDLKYSQGQSALPWKWWYPNQIPVYCFCGQIPVYSFRGQNFLFPHMCSPAVSPYIQFSTIISLVHLSLCLLISARCC